MLIGRILLDTVQYGLFVTADTQFNRVFAKHWNKKLAFDFGKFWVRPSKRAVVGDVDQCKAVAVVLLACGADGVYPVIAKGIGLLVTVGTGLLLVGGQTFVVEQVAAKGDFFYCHRVFFGYRWGRKFRWQRPVIVWWSIAGGEQSAGQKNA